MFEDAVHDYWHIYSDGKRADIPFASDDDKIFAMNSVAICAYQCDMEVICLEVNETHLHSVLRGRFPEKFSSRLKKRINTLLNRKEDGTAGVFYLSFNKITNRRELLTKIIYTFRNCLDFYKGAPWNYRWGVGNLYFAPRVSSGTPLSDMSARNQREILSCWQELPQDWRMDEYGMLLPSSYINVDLVESLFGSVKAFLAFLHLKKDDEQQMKQTFSQQYIEQRSMEDLRHHANRLAHNKYGNSLRVISFESRLEIAASMLRGGTGSRTESFAKALYLKKADIDRLL